jgi:hypothetical protein
MNTFTIFTNFINPPVSFFFLGLLAAYVKSDLEIPQPIAKFISLYLLMAIGFKGGYELHHSGFTMHVILTMLAALIMAIVVPIYSFFILKRKLDVKNAGALAACFGSVSVVTFIAAGSLLKMHMIEYGGEMVAALAIMESPAIIIGVWLIRKYDSSEHDEHHTMKEIFQEAFFNGSIMVLVGSLLIGYFSNEKGMTILSPFTEDLFKGMLSFFLLDMGVVAGKRMKPLLEQGKFLISFGILMPILNAFVGIGISNLLGLPVGDSFMFTVLCASASYVAVPAAMRIAVPEANPGIYIPMALAITFPFNITIGMPFYLYLIEKVF